MNRELLIPSPVETISVEGRTLYLKRDDLIHPDFSGNKARKLHYFLTRDFKDVDTVVSYGSAQSNAMYSLSVLAKLKGWSFVYYVDRIPSYLQAHPHGNFQAALENGMEIRIGKPPQRVSDTTLVIEEGVRQHEAAEGMGVLAQEIIDWQLKEGIQELAIFLPSGTGTTALFLQKSLLTLCSSLRTQVYTCACVGDVRYLQKQFKLLEPDTSYHPRILSLEKKYRFGKLYKEHYEIWLQLCQQTGVTFDLLYDPLGWRTLLAHPHVLQKPTMYLHQGGLKGNESMLPRFTRKWGATP